MYFLVCLIHFVMQLVFYGSIVSSTPSSINPSFDTDTIAGETASIVNEGTNPSTNIDVVGLAVFKGDVLVR